MPDQPIPPSEPPKARRNRKKNTLPPNIAPVAYEYKMVPYMQQNAEELFNVLAVSGWRFRGHLVNGPAVFERPFREKE